MNYREEMSIFERFFRMLSHTWKVYDFIFLYNDITYRLVFTGLIIPKYEGDKLVSFSYQISHNRQLCNIYATEDMAVGLRDYDLRGFIRISMAKTFNIPLEEFIM